MYLIVMMKVTHNVASESSILMRVNLQFWTLCANLEINLITYTIDKDGVIL